MKTFETVRIGDLSLSNRLLMAPVKTGFGDPDGKVRTAGDRLMHSPISQHGLTEHYHQNQERKVHKESMLH